MRQLLALGCPAAAQIGLEVGVFSAAAILAEHAQHHRRGGPPNRDQQRGHHLHGAARDLLGWSGAGGPRDRRPRPAGARRAGWTALVLGLAFMSLMAAVLFLLFPRGIFWTVYDGRDADRRRRDSALRGGGVPDVRRTAGGGDRSALRGLGDTQHSDAHEPGRALAARTCRSAICSVSTAGSESSVCGSGSRWAWSWCR